MFIVNMNWAVNRKSHGFVQDSERISLADDIIIKGFVQANPRVVYACTVFTENYRVRIREFWMIYRGPGFHAILWFGSSSTPSPLSSKQIVSLSQSSCVSPVELTGRWGKGRYGGGAKSCDSEKAWSLINHPILSAEYGHTWYCR